MEADPMPSLRRRLLQGSLLLMLVAGFGCAGNETREYARELDPLVGRAPIPFFIDRFGEPEKRIAVDSRTEILQFRVATESLDNYGARGNLKVTTELRLTFRDGILAGWRASNAVR
jgi:hypothetical protein